MDDWKPGDLALCVKREPWVSASGPAPGSVNTVAGTIIGLGKLTGVKMLGLVFAGSREAWRANAFRKIHPLNEAERDAAMRDLNSHVREPVTPFTPFAEVPES